VATEPLPLDQPAELVGEWWLPDAPDDVASGRLIYEPYEGLRLQAVSASQLLRTGDESVAWLHGMTVDGRFVTLRNVDIVNWRMSMPGGVLAEANVAEAFVGLYAKSDNDLRFHQLNARIANLTAWLDPAGFTVEQSRNVHTRPSGVVGLGRAPGGVLATGWVELQTDAVPPRKPIRLGLEQRGWVRFAAPRRRLPWAEANETLMTFREFVSLAASADSPLLEVRALATVTSDEFGSRRRARSREPVWILFRHRRPAETKEPTAAEMLFRHSDAAFGNYRPFSRWLKRGKLMEPVYDLYVAALPERGMFLENRFLAFVQALEAYDFRKTGVERKLRAVVQSAIDDLPAGLRKDVPQTFADLIKDTRHYLTHYNPKYEKKAATGDRLFFASRGMKLLFELTMLLELGFPKRKVQALVEGNRRLVGEFRMGFQSL
jgi:hypothetical protein